MKLLGEGSKPKELGRPGWEKSSISLLLEGGGLLALFERAEGGAYRMMPVSVMIFAPKSRLIVVVEVTVMPVSSDATR